VAGQGDPTRLALVAADADERATVLLFAGRQFWWRARPAA
jgi:hypothetical protein